MTVAAPSLTSTPVTLDDELELHALLAEDALELLADLAVHARQDPVEILDHGHLGPEAAPDRAEFEADDAGADDEELARDLFQGERPGGGDDDLLVDGDAGELRDVRARGDDDVLRLQELVAAVLGQHLDAAGAGEPRGAAIGVDAVLLEQELDALGVAVDAVLLEGHHLREVELGRADHHAHVGEVLARLLERLGGVQQGLRGDAADVEAGAAVGGPLLHHGRLEAELGGPDGADVTAGAGADDDEIVGHGNLTRWIGRRVMPHHR